MGASSPAAPEAEASKAATSRKSDAIGVPTKPGWYTIGIRPVNGMLPGRESVDFGGINFPRVSRDENPRVVGNAKEYIQERRGQRVYLDEHQLARIHKAMGTKIVRVRSLKAGTTAIVRAGSRHAKRPLKHDVPLEAFLYIEPTDPPAAEERSQGDEYPAALA